MIESDNIRRWQGHVIMAWLESRKTLGVVDDRIEVKDLELRTYNTDIIQFMTTKGLAITLETDESDSRVRQFT